jgi:ketosteroid isomerase-like protein
MRKLMLLLLFLPLFMACTTEIKHEKKMEPGATTVKEQPAEFADPKYAEIGKKWINSLAAGDMAGYLSAYADNAVYVWNNGDSLTGKAAISAHWTKRRTEIIDSLAFSHEIWLPIKVNKPQSVEAPGVWLLAWYQVDAKYKPTGKKMTQWMHLDMHFDANDKIDRVVQYLDMVPINEAMKK